MRWPVIFAVSHRFKLPNSGHFLTPFHRKPRAKKNLRAKLQTKFLANPLFLRRTCSAAPGLFLVPFKDDTLHLPRHAPPQKRWDLWLYTNEITHLTQAPIPRSVTLTAYRGHQAKHRISHQVETLLHVSIWHSGKARINRVFTFQHGLLLKRKRKRHTTNGIPAPPMGVWWLFKGFLEKAPLKRCW